MSKEQLNRRQFLGILGVGVGAALLSRLERVSAQGPDGPDNPSGPEAGGEGDVAGVVTPNPGSEVSQDGEVEEVLEPSPYRMVEGLEVNKGEYAVVKGGGENASELITQDILAGHLENREDLYLPSRFTLVFESGPTWTFDDSELRKLPRYAGLPRVRLNYRVPHPEFGDPMAAAESLFNGEWLHHYAENSLQVQSVEAMTDDETVRRFPLRASNQMLVDAVDQYNEFYTDEQIQRAYAGDRTATRDFVIRSTDFERTREEGIAVSEEIWINLADIQHIEVKYWDREQVRGREWNSFIILEDGISGVVEFNEESQTLTFHVILDGMSVLGWMNPNNTAVFPVRPIIGELGSLTSPDKFYFDSDELRSGGVKFDPERYNYRQHEWTVGYMGAIFNENGNTPAEWNFLMADGPTHK